MSHVDSIHPPAHQALAARLTTIVERGEVQLRDLEASLDGAMRDHDTIQEDQDSLRALVNATRADVLAARRALERFADGSYGRCQRCGDEIAADRLDVVPTAERCTRCA
jgi:RNA polymerase-binding transcription factor DksA